jgi:proteic killer suppression protein
MICKVFLSKKVRKQLEKLPNYLVDKLESWIQAVELEGLEEVRKIPGYHDEPLLGKRKDERSIRLNRAYRAIYKSTLGFHNRVEIREVSKHGY